MKCINVYLTVAVLLLSMQSIAQEKDKVPDKSQFKRLYIGDTVPMEDIVFNNVRNYPGGKAKLSDFKGKYVVLDFWGKNCSVCIAAFPHMEELQGQFKDDIQILLVTKDTDEDLVFLSKNSSNLKNTKLPIIIGDDILSKRLFPYGSAPYHVWLDRAGKVVATTYMQETNPKNLRDLIANKKLNLLVKNEVFDDDLLNQVKNQKISLLKIGGGIFQEYLKYYAQIPITKIRNKAPEPTSSIPALSYYSMFMDYIPGDMMGGYRGLSNSLLLDENGKAKGFRIAKFNVEEFYKNAYNVDLTTKIITEGKAKLLYEDITDTTNMKRHMVNNSYCYESCLPNYSFENARKLLQQDLTRFFGMSASIEQRSIVHLILTRLGVSSEKHLWVKYREGDTSEGKVTKNKQCCFFNNYSIAGFLNELETANQRTDDPIIIDGTTFTNEEKYNKRINLFLKCDSLRITTQNLPAIQKDLAKYGLELKEEIRIINALVLKAAF